MIGRRKKEIHGREKGSEFSVRACLSQWSIQTPSGHMDLSLSLLSLSLDVFDLCVPMLLRTRINK
jgi:hypothetical protein